MSRCDECGSVECRNGPSCSYLKNGNCSFCHCDERESSFIECENCGALRHHSISGYTCVECEEEGCGDCINAVCESCHGAIHYDGEGGDPCAPFTGDDFYHTLCSWCEENRSSSNDNDNSNESKSESSHTCPDCGYEMEGDESLSDHRTEGEGLCDHLKTTTSGDREICFCCGEDLGYWQSNEEFYDGIGAPYDDRNP